MTVMGEEGRPAYPIGSVDRALRLVVLLSENRAGIRIGDAAAFLEVAPSTAHRLLQTLMHRGFARQDVDTRIYFPGPTLERLSDLRERVRQLAMPILEALVTRFNETVHLAVLDGDQALTIASVESQHMLRVGNREGHTQPAVRSGMGRVLLSGMDKGTLQALLKAEGLDPAVFAKRMRELEVEGCLVQHSEVEAGVSSIAVPIRMATDGIPYAIGLTFPTGRIPEDQLAEVIKAAKEAAVQLGNELHR